MISQEFEQTSKHPLQSGQEKIHVVAITWNLFGSLPPLNSLVELSRSSTLSPPPDLIFFGTQECERSLCLSFCCESKNEWEEMLTEVFKGYSLLPTITMRGLHSAILVNNISKDNAQLYERGSLKAGLCNLMGNKGAISLEISFLGQTFQLINCHLAAHQTESEQRNATLNRILSDLVRKDLQTEVILLGDLNYRIDLTKKQYEQMIKDKSNTEEEMQYRALLGRQQLVNQTALRNNFLIKYEEGKIDFAPTYKIGINNQQYNRERIPGWTDRIFARKSKRMTRTRYWCEQGIMGCDHRPVLARYECLTSERAETNTENFVRVSMNSKCTII